ncbi:AAA family ATPase [Caldalkalibacillus thermarum TA2.A1]|uniref:AAA family ATPase n=1 Tax=Caldalkalibacillus thermarum (strain TA2.A1) TaxID=986075 RepID=A0A8X8I9U6_CALTT|nr:AAA family ATPase [Caldalkalibacillus thermarum]QZT33659.1 AAA family ATPase [Caldalkalibacillus thermarum TA2.A1]
MFEKLIEIKSYLEGKFYEREKEIEGLLVALLARQHMLLIGPAGTAKSLLSVELAKIIEEANYFQWLLTRFSTPEELFGPVSLKELEQGVYKRNTAGKLPEAHLAFVDEVFKANSAILNSLLTLINERLFYNNGHPVKTPLMTIVGASNEYPEEGEGLEALFDRFLLRYEVDYIADDQNFISMMKGSNSLTEAPSITLDELHDLQFQTSLVDVPDEVFQTLAEIRRKLRDEGIQPSDRRFKQSLSLIQAKAVLDQRDTAQLQDLLILQNTLWETPEQRDVVTDIVKEHAQDKVTTVLEQFKAEILDLLKYVNEVQSTHAVLETTKKLKEIEQDLTKLSKNNPDRDDISAMIKEVQEYRKNIAENILTL